MKSDALTIAAVVFVIGIAATALGLTDWKKNTVSSGGNSPTELQRGFPVERP